MQRPDRTLLGLVTASLLAMTTLLLSPAGDLEHGAGLELLYALRGTRPPPPEVVIITLDSRSARALGQSERPERWPRSLHARLVNGLTDRGARVIGFDVLFERA
ncbi:MAG TPA: CHASE2 domain-containing protein, partial [Zoogloea sp.]|nr:CHASE2 domain-containing protein [Zoogloea sp.]